MSIQWYGYRYKPSGDYQVKRYNDYKDIDELQSVQGVTVYWYTPFSFAANSRQEALNRLIDLDWAHRWSRSRGIEPLQTLRTRTLNREIIEDNDEDLIVELKRIIENKHDKRVQRTV